MPATAIGAIRFVPDSGFPVQATLYDNGLWEADLQEVAEFLNILYSPLTNYSPAYGPYGTMQVLMAAADFNGDAHLEHTPPSHPKRVY